MPDPRVLVEVGNTTWNVPSPCRVARPSVPWRIVHWPEAVSPEGGPVPTNLMTRVPDWLATVHVQVSLV